MTKSKRTIPRPVQLADRALQHVTGGGLASIPLGKPRINDGLFDRDVSDAP